MLASEFIAKWRSVELTERAAAHSHFRDLCDVLGEETRLMQTRKGSGTIADGRVDFTVTFAVNHILAIDQGAPITILAGVHSGCYELFACGAFQLTSGPTTDRSLRLAL